MRHIQYGSAWRYRLQNQKVRRIDSKTDHESPYYDIYIPEKEKEETPAPDLITVHINRDQLVRLTEDLLIWIFKKIKNSFKRKKKKVRDE